HRESPSRRYDRTSGRHVLPHPIRPVAQGFRRCDFRIVCCRKGWWRKTLRCGPRAGRSELMFDNPFTAAEIESRLERVRNEIAARKLDGAIFASPENVFWLT